MNKKMMTIAVAAAVAGSATVATAQQQIKQYVNPEKTGEVIMFPFYNADNGNATNMHLVNTTGKVKAVKLRFVEYKNSDEVLDFNLYLSPYDHFAFGVIKNPNGDGAAVITSDNSCTVPALGGPNGDYSGTVTEQADGSVVRIQPFVNYQYANTKDIDSSIERTLTGHVEAIEMGTVTDDEADSIKDGTAYAAAATHGPTGVPADCGVLEKAWSAGEWSKKGGADENMGAPEGGLYGLAYHINVEAAAAFGFEPVAVDNWATGIEHTDPGSLLPSLASGTGTAIVHDQDGAYVDVTFPAKKEIMATSAVLATTSLSNDVMINPALGGQTDWVVSFPTKRFHVDVAGQKLGTSEDPDDDVLAPFTGAWVGNTGGTSPKEVPACETVEVEQWDREEAFTAPENGFSPSPAQLTNEICNEVAVFAMGTGADSALSVETGLFNLSFPYAEGWQRISMDQKFEADTGGLVVSGLPVVGFAAYKVNNGAMSYGNAAEHKTDNIVS